MAARSADEIFVAVLAHLGEGLLRRHASVHEPEVADLAIFRLKPPDERHLRLLVARVAGKHLVGERETVRRQDEGNHDLEAVPSLVAAVSVALDVAVERLRAVNLEVGARQVEEDNITRRAEETSPAVSQKEEEVVLERVLPLATGLLPFLRRPNYSVEAAVERREPRQRPGVRKPVRVHRKFAAGIREAVHDDGLHDCEPIRAFAAGRKAMRPEAVQPEPIPQLRPEPDFAPVAHVLHSERVHAYFHYLVVARLGSPVSRKQFQLPHVSLLVERLHRPLPFILLRVVQLAEI